MDEDELLGELLHGAPPATPRQRPVASMPAGVKEIPVPPTSSQRLKERVIEMNSPEMWMARSEIRLEELERQTKRLSWQLKLVAGIAAFPFLVAGLFLMANLFLSFLSVIGA